MMFGCKNSRGLRFVGKLIIYSRSDIIFEYLDGRYLNFNW